jgi:hypothetical protein
VCGAGASGSARGLLANSQLEMQRLVACLDLLAEHFASEVEHDLGQGAVV